MKRREYLGWCATMACAVGAGGPSRAAELLLAKKSQEYESTGSAILLPVFPLGIVVFPGELVLLHIFEPRYKALINECLESDITFGIPTILPGGLGEYGSEVRLERVLRTYDSGEMDIAVRGVRAFRLHEFQSQLKDRPYPGGRVRLQANDPTTESALQSEVVRRYNRLHSMWGTGQKLVGQSPENLSFVIGHEVRLTLEQELGLLALSSEADRQRYLLRHMKATMRRLQGGSAAYLGGGLSSRS
jgi:Lon protease-like protein